MLYYFFEYLESQYQIPGASLFTYISFRAAAAIITSLLISTIFGKRIIDFLRKKQIGESVRDLGLDGQIEKTGTPTMGGLIIIISTIIPVLLFANLKNIYIILIALYYASPPTIFSNLTALTFNSVGSIIISEI